MEWIQDCELLAYTFKFNLCSICNLRQLEDATMGVNILQSSFLHRYRFRPQLYIEIIHRYTRTKSRNIYLILLLLFQVKFHRYLNRHIIISQMLLK